MVRPNLLPKDDPRYLAWRASLKKRPASWSKGKTKETSKSVRKISRTFLSKKIDNFAGWRAEMRRLGKIKTEYPLFEKNGDLAELIGVILGDGHIERFPRTEGLLIFSNSNNQGFIDRYSKLVGKIFKKTPRVYKVSNDVNCVRIRLYEKEISKRLNIPTGKRTKLKLRIPPWILNNRRNLIRYLRGLFEAEGSFCVHKPTSTYKLLFANRNKSLLKIVFSSLASLGFHPSKSADKVQISRKLEVYECIDLLQFRKY